ncbi:MAG: hypothetical protein HYX27_26445 [Acidobacteria bacterium]|nr:hypothetical protein [Acidobacteriota bacterium]
MDERRNRLYVTNLAAYRVEVINTQNRSLESPILTAKPPSAVGLSPDNRFLVTGQYDFQGSASGGYTISDLDGGVRRDVIIPNGVLAVAFGAGSRALVITTANAFLVEPFTAATEDLGVRSLSSAALPVPFATFPQKITFASLNVSGDGKTIVCIASIAAGRVLITYPHRRHCRHLCTAAS